MAPNSGSQVTAEDFLTELEIAIAFTDELEEYIIQDDLYRTVFASTSEGEKRLVMTGGDLLSRLHRIAIDQKRQSAELQARAQLVQERAAAIIYSLKTRFDQRLLRETKARIDSLRWYLDDCASDPTRCRTNFPYEMRNRQRIEEILKRTSDNMPADLAAALQAVDRRIRQLTHGTTFIWDDELKDVFPSSPYWYLYVSP